MEVDYSNSKVFLEKLIPILFYEDTSGKVFPENYKNDVKWWGNITREKIHSCLENGTAKMLTMDLDIGDVCSLRCPHCFRRDRRFDTVTHDTSLSYKEIIGYIKEAKELGLEQIKILGRGEPFENNKFLGFLREVNSLGIGISIFTKGHVLGSDDLAVKYNKSYGISTGKELVDELKKLKVSILLGFNTFDEKMQGEFVGIDRSPVKNYVELRDNALKILVEAGFNDYVEGEATRLAMIAAPIKPENIDEIFDLFIWARVRNIYMLSCPTTISGKGIDEYKRAQDFYGNEGDTLEKKHEKYIKDLENLYIKIYRWSIAKGLILKDTFEEDGVSLYPGSHVCNQTAAGFYLNLSGQVNQCPGRMDGDAKVVNDIRNEESLKSVWMESSAYKRAKNGTRFNYKCLARDGHSIPVSFYENIKNEVLKGDEK